MRALNLLGSAGVRELPTSSVNYQVVNQNEQQMMMLVKAILVCDNMGSERLSPDLFQGLNINHGTSFLEKSP